MKRGWILFVVVVALSGVVYVTNRRAPESTPPISACDPVLIRQTMGPFNSLLRAFDDASVLAFNLPREAVIEPTMRLQELRREVESTPTVDCVMELKASMLDYMNGILNVLVGFMGGAPSAQTQAGLEDARLLRESMDAQIAMLLDATVTPYPTPFESYLNPSIERSEIATPEISYSPTTAEVRIRATVKAIQGVHLRLGPGFDYSFQKSVQVDTALELIGISEDGYWALAEVPELDGAAGWVFVSLLALEGDQHLLPIIAIDAPSP